MPHDEGLPHAKVYKPTRTFEEIAREKREREMRAAGHRPPDGAFRPPRGRDHLGRPYVAASFPWAEEQAGGVVRVDVEGAASQGVRFLDMGDGIIRMEE